MVGQAASATETTLLTWSRSGRADVIARIVPSNSTALCEKTVIMLRNRSSCFGNKLFYETLLTLRATPRIVRDGACLSAIVTIYACACATSNRCLLNTHMHT